MNRIDTLKTVNVLALAFLIGFLIFGLKVLLWIACLLVLGNAFESRITTLIARRWLQFASFLGNVNTKVILSIIFYLALTPIAFIYRLFNKDAVAHFRFNNKRSLFDNVNKAYQKTDFEKQW